MDKWRAGGLGGRDVVGDEDSRLKVTIQATEDGKDL